MPFLFVCLIGLLISVQASPASSPVVEGQVRLAAGSPVAGAQVVLFDVADLRRGPIGQATTDEAGMFVLPLTAADGALVLPRAVRLGPNYPNPFNPSTVWFSGALSGEVTDNLVAEGDAVLSGDRDVNGVFYVYSHLTRGTTLIGGDNGSPAYTAPDANNNVRIVGIATAIVPDIGITFESWEKIEDTFDLKPVAAPASDGPTEDEEEEDLAGFFSVFD